MDVTIDLETILKPSGLPATPYKYRVLHQAQEIGAWNNPACPAARRLLELGLANREDTLRILHNGIPSLTGRVGWFADRYLSETDRGLHYGRWKPFPAIAGRQGTPSNDL